MSLHLPLYIFEKKVHDDYVLINNSRNLFLSKVSLTYLNNPKNVLLIGMLGKLEIWNLKDFKEYKQDYDNALTDKKVLAKMIYNSLKIKKSYIEIDEFDQNKRQVFNYGHSFGHAIESLTNYAVPHGIAVSFGMDMANFISVKKNFSTGAWLNFAIKKKI